VNAERIAHNEALFRQANDRIAGVVMEQDRRIDDELPFLCECHRIGCTQILRLTLPAYQRVRTNRRLFICAPGHAPAADESERVVEEGPGYVVAEKYGPVGELAERLS
jgi:hypothetical protein